MTGGAGQVSGTPPKLLFDQNLSRRLARVLASLYPGSAHVSEVGLAEADDEVIWAHAATHGYVIVTKDDDFRQRSFVRGQPPKVIWTRLGNCRTADVESALRARHTDVVTFAADQQSALLVIAQRGEQDG
ncbi:MAG: DUF5615 family PIN-like protein [Gemmatimonadaceae bacterium]